MIIKRTCVVIFMLYALFFRPAYAYLDPGTGSYILQIIIAGVLAGLFAVKCCWSRIKNFFKELFSGKNNREKNG